MPKRKQPPARVPWARFARGEWQLTLGSGERLSVVRELSMTEARELAELLPVFLIGYLLPVRELTGDDITIRAAVDEGAPTSGGVEWNSFAMFSGDRGTRAVVIEHHH